MLRRYLSKASLRYNRFSDYRRFRQGLVDRYDRIVAQDPSAKLSSKTLRQIEEYAREVLGSRHYVPALNSFAAYRGGNFFEGWITQLYFRRIVMHPVQGRYFDLSCARTLSRRVLGPDLLPDIAYRTNGTWFDDDCNPIASHDVEKLLFSKTSRVFVKHDFTARGLGVYAIDRASFDLSRLEARGNFVVQSAISQSPFFDQFTPNSVATLRITTLRSKGGPAKMCAAYLRLARKAEKLVSSDTALRVPIVDETGALADLGSPPDWTKIDHHPDSGAKFAGQVIPSFAEAVEICKRLHDEKVPQFAIVGWDIAIDATDRMQIIEWNTNNPAIDYVEAAVGPLFVEIGWPQMKQKRAA